MTAASDPIAAEIPRGVAGVRGETREETVRIVEYAGFPRVAPQQQLRVGFTRDISDSGMCLGVDWNESIGSLLRLCIRGIDGRDAEDCAGRVVWTRAERDGRFWLGIELLAKVSASGVAKRRKRNEKSHSALRRIRT